MANGDGSVYMNNQSAVRVWPVESAASTTTVSSVWSEPPKKKGKKARIAELEIRVAYLESVIRGFTYRSPTFFPTEPYIHWPTVTS